MMSRLTKDTSLPGPSASTSHEGLESDASSASNRTLKVTLLSSEWGSSKGGLSTINRELAIQLAKHPNVEVCMYLPRCSEEDKRTAACHKVHLIEAEEMPGYDPVDWLASTPKDHVMDCVIGHGVHLGRQVPHIKRVHGNCKWVQLVHTDPEELGMFKNYANPISKSEKKHQAEVKLCQLADQVVAVGSKLAEAFAAYLRPSGKDQDVFNLTPSIFTEFMDVTQAIEERKIFRVLVFGCGDSEDFRLKGYDIAAKAIAELKDMPQDYKLVFVGAAVGEEEKVTELLLKEGIARSQLTIRRFDESREHLAELFCEVDLAIMPSRTEGFGLAALEALSAGLPVLVSGNSGLGDALKKVPHGSNCVVNSDDPKRWAEAVQAVCDKDRGVRLGETKDLCGKYAETYSWEEQCGRLVQKMMDITLRSCDVGVKMPKEKLISVEEEIVAGKPDSVSTSPSQQHQRRKNTGDSTSDADASFSVVQLKFQIQDVNDSQQETVNELLAQQIKVYMRHNDLCRPEGVSSLIEHIKMAYNMALKAVGLGCLEIAVQCPSLESLENLWSDYCSGHLDEVAERLLVTDDLKRKLGLETVRIKTTIEEENYLRCKRDLMGMSGSSTGSVKTPRGDPPVQEHSAAAATDKGLSEQQPSSDEEGTEVGANEEGEPSGEQSLQERKRKTSGSKFDLVPVPNGSPSLYELEMLSRRIGDKWKSLAFELRFHEGDVTGFDRNNPLFAEKVQDMLFKWKDRDGAGATYQVLCDALRDELVGCGKLAETLASGRFAKARKDDEAELQVNLR